MGKRTTAAIATAFIAAAATLLAALPSQASTPHRTYDDTAVVDLLIFGQGPVAKDHPDLAKHLDHGYTPRKISLKTAARFTASLMKVDPEFHRLITLGVQKDDPYAASAALKRLNTDIGLWYAANGISVTTDGVQPDKKKTKGGGYNTELVWFGTSFVVGIEVAAFSTVAVGAEAVLVVAIIPAAASYQFTYANTTPIDHDDVAASLAAAF